MKVAIIASFWIEVNFSNTKLIAVGSIYRPLSSKESSKVSLEGRLPHAANLAGNSDMVLTGDFKLDLLKQKSAKAITQ